MSVALGLFVNKVLTPKNLSIEEFKDLGVYLREPARNIRDFELINTENKPFAQEDFIGNWNLIFFGLRLTISKRILKPNPDNLLIYLFK